jgi:hypothetical protein
MSLRTALYILCFAVLAVASVQLHDALKAEEQRLAWAARV